MSKTRIVKDFDKLDVEVQEQMKLYYSKGFEKHLIKFKDKEGKNVSALPFETENVYYLVRMTITEAQEIIEEDDDYGDDGFLRDDVLQELEDKYDEEEEEDF
jgi:hypothetical protein